MNNWHTNMIVTSFFENFFEHHTQLGYFIIVDCTNQHSIFGK